jgi:hypothetical protein
MRFFPVLLLLCLPIVSDALNFDYHDHNEMTKWLHYIADRFPQTAALYEIGKSGQGRIRLDE